MKELIKKHIEQSIATKNAIVASGACMQNIEDAASLCKSALASGNKILIAGNGGSAADAQHIAAELVGRFEKTRHSMAAIALTTDTSAITAIANDFGFEHIFARQLEGLGAAGDIFIAITTSGNSGNIIKAVETAKNKKIKTIGLCGDGGQLPEITDICIQVPCKRTATIQESHIMIGHILCAMIEAD